MIDDVQENLDAAARLGMQTLLFRSSHRLGKDLEEAGVLRRSLETDTSLPAGRPA
jgi:FMN phosphatase YigB (HAD superfamily)